MELTNFEDRISTYPGRKKLTIISQSADTMIVDEVFADKPIQEGTKINANVMKKFQQGIIDANTKSDNAISTANSADIKSINAVNTANTALTSSQNAVSISNTANTKSDNAVSTANEAKDIAEEALNQVVEKMGTKVFIDNKTTPETLVTFTSDPQTQITANKTLADSNETRLDNHDTELAKIKNNTTTIANSNGGFSCGSGASNSSGLQFKGFTLCDAEGKVPVARLVDAIYPIDSIYMSTNSTNPETLFGGKWDPLKDRFLLGAGDTYSAGEKGGESTHTLTTNEMPSHTHTQNAHGHQVYGGGDRDSYCYGANYGTIGLGGCINNKGLGYVNSSTNGNTLIESTTATNQNTGGGAAHNNMPPYLVVYMWKRIS